MFNHDSFRLLFIALAAAGAFARPSNAQDEPINIGAIKPGERISYTIAVPEFQPMKGSKSFNPGALNDVIYNDLELTGYFRRAGDPGFVEEAAAADRRRGNIDYGEWASLKTQFFAVCECSLDASNNLTASCRLFSVPDQDRILGTLYSGVRADKARDLAHRIADDIVYNLTHVRGIASTKIVYMSRRGAANEEIYVCDADGFNPRPLTRDHSLVLTPAWGANALEIYFTSYRDHYPDLWGAYVDGSQIWPISRKPSGNVSPSYNPENGLIAFSLDKDGNSEIYTATRAGESPRRLTHSPTIDSSPCWSPDGRSIAFTSDRDTRLPQIYLMDADGNSQRRITFEGNYNDSADWSPGGDRIAFVSRGKDRILNIFTMNVDGSAWRQLTRNSGNNEDPSWAPNGEQIVFSSDRSGKYALYIMNADGTNVRKLGLEGENFSPDWSPFTYEMK